MIEFKNISNNKPFQILKKKYEEALSAKQSFVEAIAIASLNKTNLEVNSRFVNIKFIEEDELVFFSNYKSNKAKEFETHNQVACIFFWPSINTQVRIKGRIYKKNKTYNNEYFKNRSLNKNALAISSNQSKAIKSYKQVKLNYEKVLSDNDLSICPDYWGGYSIKPFEFEFWEGHDHRLNVRNLFVKKERKWSHYYLEP